MKLEDQIREKKKRMEELLSMAVSLDGLQVVVQKIEGADVDALIKAASMLSEKDYVAILGSGGKMVATVGETGLARGLKAEDIIRTAAKVLGGGGGGKPQIAQGGGPNAEKLGEALEAGLEAVRSAL